MYYDILKLCLKSANAKQILISISILFQSDFSIPTIILLGYVSSKIGFQVNFFQPRLILNFLCLLGLGDIAD